MKKLAKIIVAVAMSSAAAGVSRAQTGLYATVTNLWWNGPKTNILAIAEDRLAANGDDIVGIVLKAEYDISFSRAPALSNSLRRVLAVGAGIDTPAFAAAYPRIAWNVSGMFVSLCRETDETYEEDLPKGFLLHKDMDMKWAWDALNEDGWLDAPPTNSCAGRTSSRKPAFRPETSKDSGSADPGSRRRAGDS